MKVTLLGQLGVHARGKTLAVAASATAGEPPAAGVALAFGKEAQQEPELLAAWTRWAQEPGRVHVLVPPFQTGSCPTPTRWEARRTEPLAGGETELGRVLARERQHELRGELVPAERVGGQVITGMWRRHPTAGLSVVTALPLWSLRVLDHPDALRRWLEQLVAEAGVARPPSETATAVFVPTPDDWSVLLHLCTGPYGDNAAALEALASSNLFRVGVGAAGAALVRLQAAGWVDEGTLTEPGRSALYAGPYAHHARALARMRHA